MWRYKCDESFGVSRPIYVVDSSTTTPSVLDLTIFQSTSNELCMALCFFTFGRLNSDIYCFANGVDPDQLASKKPTDLDLNCLLLYVNLYQQSVSSNLIG